MIGFFPTPYPDELLYSACARYGKRVNYPNRQTTMRELFGSKGLSAVVDFPNRLENLLASFPPHNYTTNEVIGKNTLFPFYEPFVSVERVEQVRGEMKFSKENHIRMRLAVNIQQVKSPEYLRFCPLCVENDRRTYGETFWHRIHQLAGVLVCARHNCFLQNSVVRWERESAAMFHCAEGSLNMQPPRYLCNDDSEHQLFLYLARNAEWLLTQKNLCLEEGALRERYYNLLLERRYAYYNSRIRNSKLFDTFNEHFTLRTLENLGCVVESAQRGWLAKFTEKQKVSVVHHPIRHLLVMNFLNLTAEEFFNAFVEHKPFGDGPYPCLNKASDHYGQLSIPHCEVLSNRSKDKNKSGRPLGVFSCDCGFTYQRIGPDKLEEDRLAYNSVREYGKVWENELEQLWMDLSISAAQIARILEVSDLLVVRHAIRLNLPMNESNSRNVQGYTRYRNPNKPFSDLLAQYRQKWIQAIKDNPKLTRQELINTANFFYLWLRRNDSEWFEQHLPEVQKLPKNIEHADWRKIDEDLSSDVERTCQEILASTNPLRRVCITEIIRRIGNKSWIEKRTLKLPNTTVVINRCSESWENFMLRKIESVEKRYIMEKRIPRRKTFLKRARLENKTSENSSIIQEAVTTAIERIKMSVE